MAMFAEKVDLDPRQSMSHLMGPHAVDQQIRQAVSLCWMVLPEEKKTVEAVEAEIRRIVDRALKDLRDDAAVFGIRTKRPMGRSKKAAE